MSKIEDRVAKQLLDRAKVGENKYGTTMERNDLSLMEWFQHLQEELLDAAVYVEKLKQEVQYQEHDLVVYDCFDCPGYNPEQKECCYSNPCSAHDKQMQEDEDHPKHFDQPFPEDWDEFLEEELLCGTPDQEVPEEVIMEMLEGSIAADLAEIEREKRMNIIGQNGNDGLHYETGGDVYVAVDNTGVSEWDNTNISSTRNISTRRIYPGDITITETNGNKETK